MLNDILDSEVLDHKKGIEVFSLNGTLCSHCKNNNCKSEYKGQVYICSAFIQNKKYERRISNVRKDGCRKIQEENGGTKKTHSQLGVAKQRIKTRGGKKR